MQAGAQCARPVSEGGGPNCVSAALLHRDGMLLRRLSPGVKSSCVCPTPERLKPGFLHALTSGQGRALASLPAK
eukprot:7437257-Lingulodinium_polyedra.AAC.1